MGSKSLFIDILIRQTFLHLNKLRLKKISIVYLLINLMGGYISVLYMNYNIPVYNENQYAISMLLIQRLSGCYDSTAFPYLIIFEQWNMCVANYQLAIVIFQKLPNRR